MIRRYHILSALLLLAAPAAVLAQGTLAFWNNTTGLWSEPGRWSSFPAFPNGPDFGAVINGGNVSLDGDFSVQFFGMGGGTLTSASGRTLNSNAGFTFLTGSIGNGSEAQRVTVVANAGLRLLSGAENGTPGTAGAATLNAGTLTNAAGSTATQSNTDNPFFLGHAAQVNNHGTWLAQTNNGLQNVGGNSTFQNSGLFRRENGTGTYTIGINGGIAFVNAGSVDLQTGVLAFNSGGSSTGQFSSAGGTRLEFNSDYTFQVGTSVSGAGVLQLGNGTQSFSSTLTLGIATVRKTSGTMLIAQDQTLGFNGSFEWMGGQLGNGLTAQSGTLRVGGGVVFGPGGGQTVNNATLLVPAGAAAFQVNTSDFVRLANNGQIRNDGTYYARTDNGLVNNGGGGVGFVNNGTFVRDTALGVFNASINGGIVFTNAGTVQVLTGTLALNAGGSSSGNFDIAAGAVLDFGSGYTFDAGTTVTGAGRIFWRGGTQVFPTSITLAVAQPRFGSGSFLIAQDRTLTFSQPFEWTGGSIGNGLPTQSGTLRANGGIVFGPDGGQTINNATLHVPPGASAFQVNTSDFVRLANNGQIRNDGTYYARTDNGLVNNGGGGVGFVNNGTFIRDTATGLFNTAINGGIVFTNAGAVQVRTGTLAIPAGGRSSGNFDVSAGAVLDFSNGYTFDVGTSLTGGGRVVWTSGAQVFPVSLPLSIAQPRLTGGALLIAQGQTLTLGGAFEWLGGSLGNGLPANGGTLRVNGGITLGGNGGQTINTATLHVPSGAVAVQNNAGDFVRLQAGGQLLIDGTYFAQTNNGLANNGGGGVGVVVNGTFIRDTGSGVFNASVSGGITFTNAGDVQVQTGRLFLGAGGSSTGKFQISSNAVLEFGTSYTFAAGTTALGAGTLLWSGGNHVFPASLVLGVAQPRLTGGSLLVAQGQTLALSGALDWPSGQLGDGQAANSGTLRVDGGVRFSGGGETIDRATLLVPSGATAVQSNPSDFVRLANGGQLRNEGTYYARTNNGLANNGGGGLSFLNHGTFVRDTLAGNFNVGVSGGVAFLNAGSVQVLTGSLQLNGGGLSEGSFHIADQAMIDLTSDYQLAATASASGAGTLRLSAGTLGLPASVALGMARFVQTGGSVNVAVGQTLALSGMHDWSAGTLVGGGTLLAGGGAWIGSVGINNATYAIPAGATATLPGGSQFFGVSSGGRVNNAGTLLARSDAGFNTGGGGATIVNSGLLQRDSGSGTFLVAGGMIFDNTGTTTVSSGTLRLDGSIAQAVGGTLTAGTWQVNDGAALTGGGFGGGLLTNAAIVRLSGAGSIFPALDSLTANNGTLRLDARNFTTAGSFTNAGRLELVNGSALTVPASGTLTNQSSGVITGAGSVNGTLVNFGTVEARGAGTTLVLTGEVTNNGLFVAAASGTINAVNTTFVNNGVLDNTTGTILLPAGFINNGVVLDASRVRIRSTVRTGNTVTLAVDGFSGHSYQLQRSLDLATEPFVNLGAPQPGTSGSQLIFTDDTATGAKAFYRVVVD